VRGGRRGGDGAIAAAAASATATVAVTRSGVNGYGSGEWTEFDQGWTGRRERERRRGQCGHFVCEVRAPRLPAMLVCPPSVPPQRKWQKCRRVTICDGKCAGACTKLANKGVPSIRMEKVKKS
jgi:hypothetical protein